MARRSRRTNAGRRNGFSFAFNADANIGRNTFRTPVNIKTTFNSGYIVPIVAWEVLPGDTLRVKFRQLVRLWTCVVPFMDNLKIDFFFFYVPDRLVWDNFEKFMGDRSKQEDDETDYIVPTITGQFGKEDIGEIFDMYSIPVLPGAGNTTLEADNRLNYGVNNHLSAFVFRGYNLIYNEWFRPEWIIDPVEVPTGDGPDPKATYKLLRRAKRLDYFTGALPFPQAGPAVQIPVGQSAPIVGNLTLTGAGLNIKDDDSRVVGNMFSLTSSTGTSSIRYSSPVSSITQTFSQSGLSANLEAATGIDVNQFRMLFQLQRFYEKLARGGARYTEIIRSMFGVCTGDARLQRPEFLGGGTLDVYVNPVVQTSATGASTPLGKYNQNERI